METITLYSSDVYLAEDNSNPDSYIAKFIICDFGRNKNTVALDREHIDEWVETLKNKPLVGKIKLKYDGTYDFSGHNVKTLTKTDEDGNSYKEVVFDTDAFGTFFDVGIEEINGIEYIVASCEIWKRFTKACEIIIRRIQSGTLHTSWEIAVEKSRQGIVDGLMTKIIEVGRFLGHCLLASDVSPAYDSSGLLEIASENYDMEFAEALSQDIISHGLDKLNNQEKEDYVLKEDKSKIVSSNGTIEEVSIDSEVSTDETNHIEETTKAEETTKEPSKNDISDTHEATAHAESETPPEDTELSALTERDLRSKIREACRAKLDKWCWISFHFPVDKEVWLEVEGQESELDFVRMTYSVGDNDTITVSEPENVTLTVSLKDVNTTVAEYKKTIAEKDELIVKASSEITSLKSENTELSQYKEKFTQLEQEKLEAELEEKKETLISSVIKSGQITREEIEESEELSGYVNNLDKGSLMSIVGERLIASLDKKEEKKVETSEIKDVQIASNLNNDDDETINKASIMRKFLHK